MLRKGRWHASGVGSHVNSRSELLALYEEFPFEHHPLWRAVLRHELSYDQVMLAEVQHYLRSKRGRTLREEALWSAKRLSPAIFEMLLQTYLEECTEDDTGPSHMDLVKRLVVSGGYAESELDNTELTPGNVAAIALYRDISERGAACHMLGAGAVEHYYSRLSPSIFNAYTTKYKMSEHQAETYKIHGPMDKEHAERAFNILDEAIALSGWREIRGAVRDAFVATSLHYDGMLQAATGEIRYWNGK